MEAYLTSVLDLLSKHGEDDPILQCECEHLDNTSERADELLALADQRLHVFPFKEVKSCWFRLYTDASIAKAVKLLLAHLQNVDHTASSSESESWVGEVVAILDRALIMAGGIRREDTIHEILRRLQEFVDGSGREEQCVRKRRKLKHSLGTNPKAFTRGGGLPEDEFSVPKLKLPVSSLNRPSMEFFQEHMNNRDGPIVLNGILEHWPALELWKTTRYWHDQTFGGRRLVPVELGRSYVDDDWGQKIMPFKDFMTNHIFSTPTDSENDATKDIRTGYLAQHDLLKQIPSLYAAIATPDYCYLDAPPPEPDTPVALSKAKRAKGDQNTNHPSLLPPAENVKNTVVNDSGSGDIPEVQANVWFGPAWTISPLHHDPYHNILCQVVGKKYIRLYSPHHSSKLYSRPSDEPAPHLQNDNTTCETSQIPTIDMSNTSSIDVAAMELSPHEEWIATYPDISGVPYLECILEAGQALYIPIGWWHYVRSCSVGISVSFWW